MYASEEKKQEKYDLIYILIRFTRENMKVLTYATNFLSMIE